MLLSAPAGAAPAGHAGARPRIIVSSDIGGTDFDDFQSMVHLFVYADIFDIEGIISSPYGPGRREHILKVINAYERDYPNLKTYSTNYPSPEALRAVSKQGALDSAGLAGFSRATEGSDWIIQCARRADSRPLWILIWGGIDDLAQALHDEPAIKSKIRVYFIGGPNKKWSAPAYAYIAREHPDLWIIEANDTYRGWFVGGNQTGDLGNQTFVSSHVVGRGALGDFFAGLSFEGKARQTVKMGDTPSLVYLLGQTPEDPMKDSWGGRFVRAWERRRYVFDHAETNAPTATHRLEVFSIVELIYHPPAKASAEASATLVMDRQNFPGFMDDAGAWHFILSPKEGKTFRYTIQSGVAELNGRAGEFTAYWLPPEVASKSSAQFPSWWTDDPNPALAEGKFAGAKTVSCWREEFLRDFAARLERCRTPATKPKASSVP
ncbi:MAG: DUF1593 domain-containing protein [Verrucomicrobiota bacterium]